MRQAELRDLDDLARRLAGDCAAADDLVQDVCVCALSGAERALTRVPWLRGVLRNRARMASRARARRRARDAAWATQLGLERSGDLEEVAARRRMLASLSEAVAALPEPERTMMRARWLDERTSEAIGLEHGVSAATVRWRLARGLARLRESLGAEHAGALAMMGGELSAAPRAADATAAGAAKSGSAAALWGLAVATAVAVTAVAMFAVGPMPDRPLPSIDPTRSEEDPMTRPLQSRRRLSALLPALTCAAGLGGGCLSAAPMPDDVAPDDELSARDGNRFEPSGVVSAAAQPEPEPEPEPESVEQDETEVHTVAAEPAESKCVQDCIVSATPHALGACEGEAAFDDCANTCATEHCPTGDVSYDDDVLELGITTTGDGWVPDGCDDAAAWSHCVFQCTDATQCPDGRAPGHLCNLECLAEAAAALETASEEPHERNEP